MNIQQFHQLAEALFAEVEQQIDTFAEKYDTDIDLESHGNVVTITFENQSKIIINTQEPLLQIWMATRRQGYHFDYEDNSWFCNRSHQSFKQLFTQAVIEQMEH